MTLNCIQTKWCPGMTLNCIHISLPLVAFCTDVSWGRPVNVSSYTVVFIYESWSYLILQRFLALIAFLCWCAVKQSINQCWRIIKSISVFTGCPTKMTYFWGVIVCSASIILVSYFIDDILIFRCLSRRWIILFANALNSNCVTLSSMHRILLAILSHPRACSRHILTFLCWRAVKHQLINQPMLYSWAAFVTVSLC